MTDTVENIIIEHLKSLRSEVAAMRSYVQEEFKDVKHRLGQVEFQMIGTRRDNVSTHEDVYRQQGSIDALKDRLDRIERRLELS